MGKYCLYKYRGINDNTINLLKNSQLFFSKPEDFNDINECKYKISDRNILANLISGIPSGEIGDIRKAALKTFENSMLQQKHEVRICCFSADNDNQLMWSHYADSHKGICLQFTTTRVQGLKDIVEFRILKNSLDRDKIISFNRNGEVDREGDDGVENEVIGTFAWPVIYTEDIPNYVEKVGQDSNLHRTYYAIKNKDWEYEHEYRISFEYNVLTSPLVTFDKSMLSGIIFGSRTSKRDREMITDIVQREYIDYGIEVFFYQSVSNKDSYSLTIQKL